MKFFLIAIFIQVLLHSSNAQFIHLPCTPKVPQLTLSAPDLEQIVLFFKSLEIQPKTIDDAAVTEAEILKDVAAYNRGADSEDVHLYITDLIRKYGYKAVEHTVVTDDGYILKTHNIPGNGTLVFLMHGLFSSADDFVSAGPKSGLAYYLASKGYDVWMGNARGNKHSRNHTTISPECDEFWTFSWDKIGLYDLPKMIDYALETSKKSKLVYIGHSLGTTVFYVMASELPQYNEKISLMIALSPLAYVEHMKAPVFRFLAANNKLAYSFTRLIGLDEDEPDNTLIRALKSVVCGNNALAEVVCSNLVYLLFGFDRGQLNITNLAVNFGHSLAGASTNQVLHYTQEMQSGRFCKFDYLDDKKNMKVYGENTPPDFVVENISAPVALFYSNNDWISNMTDVQKLANKLPNVVKYIFLKDYIHFDYLWAKNVNELVNKEIGELIESYT